MPASIKVQLFELVIDTLSEMDGTNAQIAGRTGIPIGDVARLMSARGPVMTISVDRYVEIARALGMTVKPLRFEACEPAPVEQRRKSNKAEQRRNRARELAEGAEHMEAMLRGEM